MTNSKALPDMFVLDALADDVEDLENILANLNRSPSGWRDSWGREFSRDEVVAALSRLVTDDRVRVYVLEDAGTALVELPARTLPPATFDDAWFGLTPAGRLLHTNWDPNAGNAGSPGAGRV